MPDYRSPRSRVEARLRVPTRRLHGKSGTGGRRLGTPRSAALELLSGRLLRWSALVFVLFFLAALGVRFFVGQTPFSAVTIERIARAELIPRLEAELGQKIEVGEFETDWLGRVIVRDIVIGRNSDSPLGALARAKTATLELDLPGLILRRVEPLQAINGVTLDEPQVYLERGREGEWNVASLFQKDEDEPKTRWTGRITLRDGLVRLRDERTRSRQNRALEVEMRGTDALIVAAGAAPWQFDANADSTRLLTPLPTNVSTTERPLIRNLTTRGSYEGDSKTGFVRVRVPSVPVAPLAAFATSPQQIRDARGVMSGEFVVGIANGQIAPRGDIRLRDLSFSAPLQSNGQTQIVRVERLNGPLRFSGTTARSTGLSAQLFGATWRVAGAASLQNQKPVFDVQIASTNAELAPLLAQARTLTPSLRRSLPTNIEAAPIGISATLRGTPQQFDVSGALQNARLAASDGAWNARLDAPRAVFALKGGSANGRLNVRYAARLNAREISGNVRGNEPLAGAAQRLIVEARGSSKPNSPVDVDVRAASWRASSPRWGRTGGAELRLVAASPSPQTRGWSGRISVQNATTGGLKLAALASNFGGSVGGSDSAISPSVRAALEEAARTAVASTGAVSATLAFSDLSPARIDDAATRRLLTRRLLEGTRAGATLRVARFDVPPALLPASVRSRVPRSLLQLRDVTLRVGFRGGALGIAASGQSAFGPLRLVTDTRRFTLELPSARIPSRELNDLLAERALRLDANWRGRIALSGRVDASDLSASFELASGAATLRDLNRNGAVRAQMGAPTLRGRIARTRDGWTGGTTLVADSWETRSGSWGTLNLSLPPSLSGARLAEGRLEFVLENAVDLARFRPREIEWSARFDAQRAAFSPSQTGVVTLRDVALLAHSSAGGVQLDRLRARWGDAYLAGSGQERNGKFGGQFLARGLNAASLQRLLAPRTQDRALVRGTLDAKLTLADGRNPIIETQLARGTLDFVQLPRRAADAPNNLLEVLAREDVPLDIAKATLELDGNRVLVREARAWSRGARFGVSGEIAFGPGSNSGELPPASGQITIRGLRVADLPISERTRLAGAPDGLLEADLRFDTRSENVRGAAEPIVVGEARLRAGSAFDASVARSQARVALSPSVGGWRLDVTDWTGVVEGAPFEGELEADTGANFWRVQLVTRDFAARRAALVRARLAPRIGDDERPFAERVLPIEGRVLADVDLNGDLFPRGDNRERPFFIPNEGYARLFATDLRFRGRPLGTLDADFQVERVAGGDGSVARIRTLELAPPAENGNGGYATPRIAAFGTLPLAPGRRDLDLRLSVGEAPLDFFVEALRDGRGALQALDVETAALDRVVDITEDLPDDVRGNVAFEATLVGSWERPEGAVSGLTVRDVRVPLPSGGLSPPARLNAAFAFEDGAFVVRSAEARLARQNTPPSTTPNADEGADDTLVRIAPGSRVAPDGAISLSADLINANLSQLAAFVPNLRGPNGAPIVRGDITEFSVRLSGQTSAPRVIGSVQAEDLAFRETTLDRLRVARFEIADGAFRIAPGNLALVRGDFESAAVAATIPFDWERGGPLFDAPIQIDFPLQTNDFGALVGFAVPSLTRVAADEFEGALQVRGTLNQPRFEGNVRIRGGELRLDPRRVPLALGVRELSGTVRFEGDRFEIAPDDPLRGRLVAASSVDAPSAQSNRERRVQNADVPVQVDGVWEARGNVRLPATMDEQRRLLLAGPSGLARLNYDLAFSLDQAALSTKDISGVRNASFAAIWRTEDGAQRVRWLGIAEGVKPTRRLGTGRALTLGQLQFLSAAEIEALPPDFEFSLETLGRAQAQTFSGIEDFAAFPVAQRVQLSEFPDQRPQIWLRDWGWKFDGVGRGILDGRLVLDNRSAIQQAPPEAVTLQQASAREPQLQNRLRNDRRGRARLAAARARQIVQPAPLVAPESLLPLANDARVVPIQSGDETEAENVGAASTLRVGGVVTLKNAELRGVPAGSGGLPIRLSLLPSVPRLDARLVIGQDVMIVNPVLRAGLEGELVAQGTPNNPQLLGTLLIINGQARFPNARARVEEGRLTVAVTRDPETDLLRSRVDIDATAQGRSGKYLITLRLSGPLELSGSGEGETLQVDVTSDPPLARSEALAQLLGISTESVQDDNDNFDVARANRAYAQAILQVLSAPLFSSLEQSVAEALGLDSVGFEYRFSEPLTVALSKALGDRVLVTYRRTLGGGRPGAPTPFELRIDYRVKGDFLVGLRTDERDVRSITVQKTWRF